MAEHRRNWMQHMAARDVRIFDAQVLNGLRQGTAFFASTTMIATGGGIGTDRQCRSIDRRRHRP